MNIRPLGDRILVKPQAEETKTASGIFLPDTVDKEKKAEGEVIALGNGEKLAKLGLSVGMKVLFKKWGGEEIKMNDEDYKILDHVDVIAVVE
ncbi:MAG: co-chaperone GroES [Candidatus Magasanikbacteria bacterium]